MVNSDQPIEIPLDLKSTLNIEQFVDAICDHLFINDTYYGNILISVTTLYEAVCRLTDSKQIKLSYHTDHQKVSISFKPVSKKLLKGLKKEENTSEDTGNEIDKVNFILRTLVDEISFKDNDTVVLEFEIMAVHKKVFDHRQAQLNAYFNHTIKEQVKKSDDQL